MNRTTIKEGFIENLVSRRAFCHFWYRRFFLMPVHPLPVFSPPFLILGEETEDYLSRHPSYPRPASAHRGRLCPPPPPSEMLRGLLASPPVQAALLGRGHPSLAPLLAVPSRGRKSRHDPPAKSKADRIKTPPPVDPPELLVILQRYKQYRGILRALREEFREEVLQQQYSMTFGEESQQKKKDKEEEHRQLMAWNDAENRRLQERRIERLRKEELEDKERRLRGAQEQAKLIDEYLKEKEKEVLQLQQEAKNFITPENLDARIEECLNNPQNYNFAVDKEGKVAKRSVMS